MTVMGFTGTRFGMRPEQKERVLHIVEQVLPTEVHHGDCFGSDEDFHNIVRAFDPNIRIVVHPGMDSKGLSPSRAHCEGDEEREVLPYLVRDGNIVKAVDILVATPSGFFELRRSGTWATIRMARRRQLEHRICYPTGSVAILYG